MSNRFDEFSKSLATNSVSRRDSFRLLGAALAGSVLAPFGLRNASAGGADPCKTFCNQCPKSQRQQCLDACHACQGETNRLCGSCGRYTCCTNPGPYQYGACVSGHCSYSCVEGAADCGDGSCTPLWSDPNNCGACGNNCPPSTPVCHQGGCIPNPCPPNLWLCDGVCVNLMTDWFNCGACGNACFGFDYCANGSCESYYPNGGES